MDMRGETSWIPCTVEKLSDILPSILSYKFPDSLRTALLFTSHQLRKYDFTYM